MTERTLFRPGGDDPDGRFPSVRRLPSIVLWGASQILLFLVLFQLYKMVRKVSIPDPVHAFRNARDILDFQGWLRLNFELDLQSWVLDQDRFFILALNRFYAHYMVGFYVLAMLCLLLAPRRFRYYRRVFIISMILALPWFYLYPLAPPRFLTVAPLPEFADLRSFTFVDTLRVFGPNYFAEGGIVSANRHAAMPSMHCGWSMIGGLFIAAALPSKWIGRTVAVAVSLGMGFVVMATGNHYWIDIIAGWGVTGASLLVNRLLPYPLPIRWPWQGRALRRENAR